MFDRLFLLSYQRTQQPSFEGDKTTLGNPSTNSYIELCERAQGYLEIFYPNARE